MTYMETLETLPGRDTRADRCVAHQEAPALVVVLECRRLIAPGRRLMLDPLDEVVVGRSSQRRIERRGRSARVLVGDFETSRQHLAIRRSRSGWQVEDLGSRNGTLVNGEPVQRAVLSPGDLIEAGGTVLMFVDAADDDAGDRDLASDAELVSPFRTLHAALDRRIAQILKVAPSSVPVLVRGETGTGKELMARAIHDASGRRGPLVAVNCGALPRGLIESELFGHRRGAFSGATEDREGLVRRAHHGTLFLDEIAELPPDSQVALLRVLQEGEVRPVGASEDVKVDVRIIAATHQDLARRISEGQFRQDLYARIAGFEAQLPALRERREDLGVLIATILPRVCAAPGSVTLDRLAARALLAYPWPLNIRELEQALRSAVALCDGGEIRVEHLPEAIRTYRRPGSTALTTEDRTLRERLVELLRESGGNVAHVARAMGRAPIQVRRWCNRLRIDVNLFRQ